MYWNFHEDDVVVVTSVVLQTQPVSAIFVPAFFFHNSLAKHIENNKFNKENAFKHFSTYRPDSLKHLSVYLFSLFMEQPSYFEKMNPPNNNNNNIPEIHTSLTSTDTYIDVAKEYFDAIFDDTLCNLIYRQICVGNRSWKL